jgi:hypothetical protein
LNAQTESVAGYGSGRDARSVLLSSLSWAVAIILLGWAAYFAITGLLQIINFGWRQPMFDQYKLYPHYLELAFPENAMQLENGHRPLIPILIRIAEIELFSANQILQLSIGATCAFFLSTIISLCAWREKSLTRPVRAASVSIAFIGIFWLGNSRMLMHGNELLHVYLLGVFVLLASLCVYRASLSNASRWMAAATCACVASTFCFGPGIAAFPAIAVVAWLSRISVRHIGWLAVGLALSLLLYLLLLPGDDGVRNVLNFRPVESIAVAARWIGSPWVNAWFGYAEPKLFPWMISGHRNLHAAEFLSVSANGIQQLLGVDLWRTGSLVLGLSAFLFIGGISLQHALRRAPMPCIENLALTLALFGGAISVVIGVGRLDYLVARPDQVFADRYLPWSCMFWLGCSLLALIRISRSTTLARSAAILLSTIIPIALLPTHAGWSGWGEAVYRSSQASAAAALSGVFDRDLFPNDDSASYADDERTLRLFRQRRLAMFSFAQADSIGKTVEVTAVSQPISISMDVSRTGEDLLDGTLYNHFQGVVTSGIKWTEANGALVAIDDQDRVQGFALQSHVGKKGTAPRIHIPRKRGFDGYIRHYDRSRNYRLALLDVSSGKAQFLIDIPKSP